MNSVASGKNSQLLQPHTTKLLVWPLLFCYWRNDSDYGFRYLNDAVCFYHYNPRQTIMS